MAIKEYKRRIATYYYGGDPINIVAYYRNERSYDEEGKPYYYHVYSKKTCLSSGYQIGSFPSWNQVKKNFVDITFS